MFFTGLKGGSGEQGRPGDPGFQGLNGADGQPGPRGMYLSCDLQTCYLKMQKFSCQL